jgi:hypothetical protein
MFDKFSRKKSLSRILATNTLPKLIVELDEANQELLLGGCFACQDTLRARFQHSDNSTSISNQYGIRSIPTLM